VNLDLVPKAYAEVQVKVVTVVVESSGYNLSGTATMSGSLMRASAIVSHGTLAPLRLNLQTLWIPRISPKPWINLNRMVGGISLILFLPEE
jgi:hypothetical protein